MSSPAKKTIGLPGIIRGSMKFSATVSTRTSRYCAPLPARKRHIFGPLRVARRSALRRVDKRELVHDPLPLLIHPGAVPISAVRVDAVLVIQDVHREFGGDDFLH